MTESGIGTDRLGREFLLWIWYESERNQGLFRLPEGKSVEVWPGGRAVLEPEEGQKGSGLAWKGDTTESRELIRAVASGRYIRRAELVLHMDHHEWTFVVDETLNVSSLRVPKPERDEGDDPIALGLERVYLVEAALEAVNALFESFLRRRHSGNWAPTEGAGIRKWLAAAGS